MIEIIQSARQSGKTTRAVQWVKAAPYRVLAVQTEETKRRCLLQFCLDRDQVVTWTELLSRRFTADHRRGVAFEIGIDDADAFLNMVFNETRGRVTLLTFNDDRYEEGTPI